MSTPEQTGRYNLYGRPYEKGTTFPYIYDPNLLLYTNAGLVYGTGGFRPENVNDFAVNVSLTGASITVGSVSITGAPVVTLTGTQSVTVTNVPTVTIGNPAYSVSLTGGFVGITGTTNVAIQGTPSVIINSGSFGLTSAIVTGGQAQIPVGARSYSIAILSGNGWINGVGPYPAPISIGGGQFDGRWTLGSAINFGTTGGFIAYGYES